MAVQRDPTTSRPLPPTLVFRHALAPVISCESRLFCYMRCGLCGPLTSRPSFFCFAGVRYRAVDVHGADGVASGQLGGGGHVHI